MYLIYLTNQMFFLAVLPQDIQSKDNQSRFEDDAKMKTRKGFLRCTLQGTNISPTKGSWEDNFRFPQVGYVSPVEGKSSTTRLIENVVRPCGVFRSE